MILITRPKSEALELQNKLKKYGYKTKVDSLISFKSQFKEIPYDKKFFYLITSSQSVETLSKYKKKYNSILNDGTFIIVGKKTAAKLKKIAPVKIEKIAQNSDEIINYLRNNKLLKQKKRNLIYLSGSVVNKEFIKSLKNIKSTIKRIVLYKVIAEDQLKASTVRLIKNKKIIMILLFSVYSTDILIKLLKQEKIYRNVKSATVVCLSDRIKKRLNKYGYDEHPPRPERHEWRAVQS